MLSQRSKKLTLRICGSFVKSIKNQITFSSAAIPKLYHDEPEPVVPDMMKFGQTEKDEIVENLINNNTISQKYLYDKKGSELYDQITTLDEYKLKIKLKKKYNLRCNIYYYEI